MQHTFFLISKNTNLHMQHTFWLSLPLFCTTTMLFCRTKTSNFLVTHDFMEKLSYNMCLPNILSPVFMHDCFYFSLPVIFTLLAASISHSHNHFEFSCFPSYKICLLFSVTRCSSFSVIHMSVNIKNNVEKDTTFCCCFFFLKVRAVMRFFPNKTLSYIWVAIPVD